jgi:hypothetical protein
VEECVSLAFLLADDLSRLLTKGWFIILEMTQHKHTIPIATKSSKTSN